MEWPLEGFKMRDAGMICATQLPYLLPNPFPISLFRNTISQRLQQ